MRPRIQIRVFTPGGSHCQRTCRRSGAWLLLASGLWCALAATASADWHHATNQQMGTRIDVELFHDDAAVAQRVAADVFAEFERLEAMLSPYRPDSALSVVNREAARQPVPVPAEFMHLLRLSTAMSRKTDGAFDVTFASAGYRYDYRAGAAPSAAELADALPAVDYRHVLLDTQSNTVQFARSGVKVDLGGIAKGYAVDQGIAILQRAGIRHGMVAAGGDSRMLGDRRGKPWVVGIKHPRQEEARAGEGHTARTAVGRPALAAVLPLADTAMSTSGDYERFFERDGVRYHHILDPSTGRSADGVRSVTIFGTEATYTDALSTSVFVLGVQAGIDLVNELPDIDAIVIDGAGKMHYSKELALAPR